MRKLLLTTATSLLGVGLMIGTASAATITCNGSISNTGPGSTNTVNCVDTNKVSVTCNNQGVITESNNQTANSGSATTSGNTSGGNASSGSSSNSNTYTVKLGASCAPVSATTSPAPSTGSTPAAAFTTSAVVATPTAATTPAPASLPTTGSNTALKTAEVGLAGVGGLALVSGVGLSLLRQRR